MSYNWINSLEGLGRVPTDANENILVIAFERFTRQYKNIMIRKSDGKQIWSKSLPCGGYSSPVVGENVIFTPTAYTKLAGLDKESGKHLWTIDLGARNRSTPTLLGDSIITTNANRVLRINSAGVIENNEVIPGSFLYGNGEIDEKHYYFVGDENPDNSEPKQFVYAVNIESLKLEWKTETGTGFVPSSDTSGIESDEDNLYVTDLNGKVTCISKTTHEVVWTTCANEVTVRHQPVVNKNKLYVTAMSGDLFCFDKYTGELLFNNKYDGEIDSPVGVYRDSILVHAGNFLHLLDEEGSTLSSYSIGHGPYSAITVIDDTVFISAGDPPDWSNLVSLNPQSEEDFRIDILEKNYNLAINSNDKDEVVIKFDLYDNNLNKITKSLNVDFRSLGGGEYEKITPDSEGSYLFLIASPQKCRYGEYSLPLRIQSDNGILLNFLYLDLRVENRNLPKKYLNENFEIISQTSPDKSGAATMQAILKYMGKNVEQDEIDEMTQFYKEINLDQHHYWRTGATRIFHASKGPLYEKENANPKLQDLFEN